jgi:hypothetical protein
VIGDLRAHHEAGGRRLSRANELDRWRWFLAVAGREIGGVRLQRDPIGWCSIAHRDGGRA